MKDRAAKPQSFTGSVLSRRIVPGAILQELCYQAGASRDAHTHQTGFVSFILEGHCREQCGGCVLEHKPNMIVLHPPGETHSHHFGDSDSRVLCIEITPSGMNHLHINGIRSLPRRAIVGGSVAQLGHRVVHQMKLNDAAANVAIEGLVLEIVSQLLRTGDSGKSSLKWMSTVMNYLHTNFAAAISLGRIAGIAGIHPVHLARSFRSSQGCTIGEYIRRLRIEEACKRLEMSDLPVTELAQECGFFDHSHFCRVFKRHVGVSPSEFRRAFKE